MVEGAGRSVWTGRLRRAAPGRPRLPTLPAMADPVLPQRARVVVVGGGVIGCSVAYHLAHMGWTDVVLLERDQLTSGTTWHAAAIGGCGIIAAVLVHNLFENLHVLNFGVHMSAVWGLLPVLATRRGWQQ